MTNHRVRGAAMGVASPGPLPEDSTRRMIKPCLVALLAGAAAVEVGSPWPICIKREP